MYGDSSGVIAYLVVAVVCGLIAGSITNGKGRGFGLGFLLGLVLSVIGVIVAAVLSTAGKICPRCAERSPEGSSQCSFCGYSFIAGSPAASVPAVDLERVGRDLMQIETFENAAEGAGLRFNDPQVLSDGFIQGEISNASQASYDGVQIQVGLYLAPGRAVVPVTQLYKQGVGWLSFFSIPGVDRIQLTLDTFNKLQPGQQSTYKIPIDRRDLLTGERRAQAIPVLRSVLRGQEWETPHPVSPSQFMESGLGKQGEQPPALKVCPQCAEDVKAAARICRFCGYNFPEAVAEG
jgi:uncharacterized membrane protein YeaQ/YmgE (transglycosylase-associated protein family)